MFINYIKYIYILLLLKINDQSIFKSHCNRRKKSDKEKRFMGSIQNFAILRVTLLMKLGIA